MILKQFSLYIVVNLSLHVQEVTLKLFSVQLVQEAMLFLEEVLELFLLVDVQGLFSVEVEQAHFHVGKHVIPTASPINNRLRLNYDLTTKHKQE